METLRVFHVKLTQPAERIDFTSLNLNKFHFVFQGSEGVPVAEPLVEGLRPDVVAFHYFTKIFASSVIIPQVKERHSEHTNTRNRRQSDSSAW